MIKVNNRHISRFELFEVSGRLDTTSADELDRSVKLVLEKGCKYFLFDFNKLEYISSYGIRIFVKLLKAGVKMSVVVKSDAVHEIFEMGGLEKPLNVKRSLREAIKVFTQTK
jgi:anti-sigma B factor antagonist